MPEGAVGPFDELAQFSPRELAGRNIERQDFDREIHERVVFPRSLPVRRKGRNVFRDIEAAIRGEASEDCLGVCRSELE